MQKAPRYRGYDCGIIMYFKWLPGQDTLKNLHSISRDDLQSIVQMLSCIYAIFSEQTEHLLPLL